jgi:hypothetical protein
MGPEGDGQMGQLAKASNAIDGSNSRLVNNRA